MLSFTQAIILGGLQGITELFPISSLGHSVILPSLLGWNTNQNNDFFLVFLVATHLATALVLFGFFFKDWILIVKGLGRSLKNRRIDEHDMYAKLGWLIIVGTIPAGILGILFQDKLQTLFASPRYVAFFLFLNGILLFCFELLRKKKILPEQKNSDEKISRLTWMQTIKIGCAEALALIPGFSRTGSTLGGGLLVGLDHESAARFSFLLATPVIFAAAVLKLPDLSYQSSAIVGPIIIGALVSAGAAYFSVKFLTKYFETNKLTPFAYYCVIAGLCSLLILLLR